MPLPNQQQKITVNLEDAVLEEQKLFQILEVSIFAQTILTLFDLFIYAELEKQFERIIVLR